MLKIVTDPVGTCKTDLRLPYFNTIIHQVIFHFLRSGRMVKRLVKKITCERCGVTFYSKFCISLHENFHQRQADALPELCCKICAKRFCNAKTFQDHQLHHGLYCSADFHEYIENSKFSKCEIYL